MKNGKAWVGVLGFVLVVGACNKITGDDPASSSTRSAGSNAAEVTAVATTAPQEARCVNTQVTYTADGSCRQSGEIVSVAEVIDGDTFKLADGRTVRLLAVEAPALKDCAGSGATAFTREKIAGKKVKLHQEPGTDTDQNGNLWRYIAYSNSVDSKTGLPFYNEDLGNALVLAGWAEPRSGGENADYMTGLTSAADIAIYQPQGMYAPPCGKPKVYGDDDGNGVADWDEDVDVDVNAPNVNMPDGALTGGFCARKWWC